MCIIVKVTSIVKASSLLSQRVQFLIILVAIQWVIRPSPWYFNVIHCTTIRILCIILQVRGNQFMCVLVVKFTVVGEKEFVVYAWYTAGQDNTVQVCDLFLIELTCCVADKPIQQFPLLLSDLWSWTFQLVIIVVVYQIWNWGVMQRSS